MHAYVGRYGPSVNNAGTGAAMKSAKMSHSVYPITQPFIRGTEYLKEGSCTNHNKAHERRGKLKKKKKN